MAELIQSALHRLTVHRESLTRDEARAVMAEVLAGSASEVQIAALLVALSMKGETVEEIAGFAEAIRAAAAPFATPLAAQIASTISEPSVDALADISGTGRDALEDSAGEAEGGIYAAAQGDALVDTCGTGGDASGTFNISTATALVAAGAGVRIAKHGNRSVTSKCGSADVMEALGVNLTLPPIQMAACLREVGIAFLYAPVLHSAMRHVQPVRRALRLRTVFNLLGPLTNPAGASAQVVGVYSDALVEKLAAVLCLLGVRRALVVHGSDGLDEITLSGPTRIGEVRDGSIRTYEVTPEEFGITRAPLSDLAGGDAEENAAIIRKVLAGESGARRDVVVLNAAAALLAAGRVNHLKDGIALAARAIDSGAASARLDRLVHFTNQR